MVALKANDADRFVRKPDPDRRAILVYGPDTGLVMERAAAIAKHCGVDTSDPFNMIRLDADTVAADRDRLLDEAFTIGMFGGERLIRVSGETRRNLAEAVKPALEKPLESAWLLIEAGDLKKSAALRTVFEKSPHAVAIPCYADEGRGVQQLIEEELLAKGYRLDRDANRLLAHHLGGDRMASRNELQKLALYAGDAKEITADDIHAIIGDASGFDLDAFLDGVASGSFAPIDRDLQRLFQEGNAPDMVILQALRMVQQLHEIRARMTASRTSAKAVIDGLRPPVFWKRKDRLAGIVNRFNEQQLERLMARLQAGAFEARANPELGPSIAGTCLLALVLESKRAA